MTPIDGTPVLTAAQMRAAEARAIAAGASVGSLMRRAGEEVARAVRRLAAGGEVLVACGPGNNGGDGYVAAAALSAGGHGVRVAAAAYPRTEAAKSARAGWTGAVESLADAGPAPVLVDALFGTGLSRPLADADAVALARLAAAARLVIAVDLPSGAATDDGALLGDVTAAHVTLALGVSKPSHLLQPAAARCGTVRLLDIGVPVTGDARVLAAPMLPAPSAAANKFSRGMVAIVKGRMAGAAHLAATAALHAGAGYVTLLGATLPGSPHALVRRPFDDEALADRRVGAVVIGPGLGRDEAMRDLLDQALASDRPLIVDGDALHLVTPEQLAARTAATIVTPHAGEFAALFGAPGAGKLDAASAAAARSRAVVVFKGADTVIAAPDGRARLAPAASPWLSTAGTGDVLAGAIGAMLAAGLDPLESAAAGVWLHGEAARTLGPAFVADDLAAALTRARTAVA